ncbi:threonylcarbamoyl-AMP synthase [Patescibacteria group bacterium]|nr:threonylcarbamoyl-AMP synthase [Patescibacteria group bacterium]
MIINKDVNRAVTVLKQGGVIAFPTDTAYALGADSQNEKALDRVYKIKGRDYNKPIGLIAASLDQVKKIAKVDKNQLDLIKKHWPGPLTILLPIKDLKGPLSIIGKRGYIGIRVPDSEVAQLLAKKLGRPITATSANLSGKAECYTTYSVVDQFMNKIYNPNFILDGGRLRKVKPSTVVKWEKNSWQIIRQGKIKIDG